MPTLLLKGSQISPHVQQVTSYRRYQLRRRIGPFLFLFLLIVLCCSSLFIGSKMIAPEIVWQSLMGQINNNDSVIILQSRLPRTITGILVGMALGAAGSLIQVLTRNPLADPGILGVNAGANFAIILSIVCFDISSIFAKTGVACLGAFIASLFVWFISSPSGKRVSSTRLILSGVAVSALLTGLTNNIALINPLAFDQFRFWQAGTLDIRSLSTIRIIAPVIILACSLTLMIAQPLNTLSMGDDIAISLGVNVLLLKIISIIAIMLLCGTATALAGPIAFVGLMIPHIARWWSGPDQRWIILHALLMSPLLLLGADIISRLIVNGELRVSIVTAFIGAPTLIWLVRQRKFSVGN